MLGKAVCLKERVLALKVALVFSSCVTLGIFLDLSEPLILDLSNSKKLTTHSTRQ